MGTFSADETKRLLVQCCGELQLYEVIEVLLNHYRDDTDRAEICASFEPKE
jgi:hypothetical protein